ncbi:hypothetical protein ABT369_55295 [Dactylosporangium sp. NPDC000244]|uniref:hypothetical protein n=1 Tax=Dactylosporangium sp. NPDC000244 TaxID=3154365 RepID=UPI003331D189
MQNSFARRAVVAAAVLAVVLAPAVPAHAATSWVTVGSDRARPLDESQGLTVIRRGSAVEYRYTGVGTIPPDVAARGFDHVGDPDSVAGWYVEPYERGDHNGKMFRAQSPAGAWTEYRHALTAGEAYNNSWSAITPDGTWMLAGEWGTMDRLLGFPTPGLNPAAVAGANLPLAFTVRLDHAVRDVQGCDFLSATALLCASDDPDGTLFGITKPLLRIDLARAPDGTDLTGHVTALRQLPLSSACSGSFEVEGIDYQAADGTLRVIVMSPSVCVVFDSKTWRLKQA